MARGAPKGTRYGGRNKGTPNKKTTEALERNRIARQAQEEVNKAAISKVKLAKDVLEDYVDAFHAMAARHQNKIAQAVGAGREPDAKDIAAFKEWGGLVVSTAAKLADFQSPKFKAIAITAPPPGPVPVTPAKDSEGKVIEMAKDPVALSRLYQQMIKKPA